MALTREDFRDAISYLTDVGILSGLGALFIDADNQMVLDEGNNNADITPDATILSQALMDLAVKENDDAINQVRQVTAKSDMQAIPNYYKWTADEMESWIDTNVIDIASAKQVLIALARMNAALRNHLFPDLEES